MSSRILTKSATDNATRALAGSIYSRRQASCGQYIAKDATIARAITRQISVIARAADVMVQAILSGGRVFYVGAGTSGRLATLDAAELPPTYGIPARSVQAVIAGGKRALTHATEGAEDSAKQGVRDLAARHVGDRDVVIGIAASGKTLTSWAP